jgi:predicted transcriptional regulator
MALVPEKKMAKPKPIFDEIDKEAEVQAIAEAEADVKAGRVVPHADVVKWLESWGTPDELPHPDLALHQHIQLVRRPRD